MTPESVVTIVLQVVTSSMFFSLYLAERSEKIRVQEARLKEKEESTRLMAEVLAAQSVVDIKNALLDQTQSKRGDTKPLT